MNFNKLGLEILYCYFFYINIFIYNSKFSMDRDINEYDEWIDNILKGWLMFREYIVKDGDCCFWVVVRNVYKLIEIRGRNIYVYEYLVYFGFVKG